MLQTLDKAKETFSAILMIASPDRPDYEVHAFEKELRKIAAITDGEVNEEQLLECTPFSCCTSAKGVLTSVWRSETV